MVQTKPLVCEYLENVSKKALEEYQPIIKEHVKGKKGVYALYRGYRLKYVGLASDLRNRLKTHLRDRHSQSWDKFSIYLTEDDKYLRELEALVLRIAFPKENRHRGRLSKSEDLQFRFRRNIKSWQKEELGSILCSKEKIQLRKKRKLRKSPKTKSAILAPFINNRIRIKADYQGNKYFAWVRSDGIINFNGREFLSPSLAAMEITKTKTLNGWKFWKYRDPKGQWVWLNEIRKKPV